MRNHRDLLPWIASATGPRTADVSFMTLTFTTTVTTHWQRRERVFVRWPWCELQFRTRRESRRAEAFTDGLLSTPVAFEFRCYQNRKGRQCQRLTRYICGIRIVLGK
jgi:hypothetical protein